MKNSQNSFLEKRIKISKEEAERDILKVTAEIISRLGGRVDKRKSGMVIQVGKK